MHYAETRCRREVGESVTTFIGPCTVTGKECRVTVGNHQIGRYHAGAKIQDAFPTLSTDDREFLMTGFSAEGWALSFPEE